jgi:hypothetical protein
MWIVGFEPQRLKPVEELIPERARKLLAAPGAMTDHLKRRAGVDGQSELAVFG